MTAAPILVPGEVVIRTNNGHERHPIKVAVEGQAVSVGEGVTLPPVETRTVIYGFKINISLADWTHIIEGLHPGLRLRADGVEVITVIENRQRFVLKPGENVVICDTYDGAAARTVTERCGPQT